MHATWGGRVVVKWIFKLGRAAWLEDALGHLNADFAETRQRREADPRLAAYSREPLWHARRARVARELYCRAATYQAKIRAASCGEGQCSKCLEIAPLIMCLQCERTACPACRVPGFLQCSACQHWTGVDYREVPRVVERNLPRYECGSCSVRAVEFVGQCHRCNRWLCEVCCKMGPPLECIVCPGKVLMRMSLREAISFFEV